MTERKEKIRGKYKNGKIESKEENNDGKVKGEKLRNKEIYLKRDWRKIEGEKVKEKEIKD